jgi:GNAT superfamily N-acetyltransferase
MQLSHFQSLIAQKATGDKMNALLHRFSTDRIAASLIANVTHQLPMMYAHMPGIQIAAEPDWLGIWSSYPEKIFNSVYVSYFSEDNLDQKVEKILSFYSSRSHLPMAWAITPICQPKDLSKVLQNQGFTHIAKAPGMFLNLDQLGRAIAIPSTAADNLHKIIQVSNIEQLSQWLIPLQASFALSTSVIESFFELFSRQGFGDHLPWRLFLGTIDGKPVSCSRLFCAAGIAGIYHVATVPEARGNGYGTAIAIASLQAAKDLGYKTAILTSSPSGYSLYRRLGFQDCCSADIYISPAQ